MTCRHCGAEVEPCPDCEDDGVLGTGYVEAERPLGEGAHWCGRITDGVGHEPEMTP